MLFPSTKTPAYTRFRTWLYVALIALYLAAKVGGLALGTVLSVLSLAAIVISLPACGWPSRLLTALFLCCGNWMLYRAGASWPTFLNAYGAMLYLLVLFAVVPVLSVPVRLGGYDQAIGAMLRGRFGSVFRLNCLVTVLSYICAAFISMAAIPIMMTSMKSALKHYPIENESRFMAVSATYGYVLPILWTPVSGVVGVVLNSLRLDWLSLFPTLFFLSLGALLINWVIFYLLEARSKGSSSWSESADEPAGIAASPVVRLMQMLLGIVLLITLIAVLESWFNMGLVLIVSLVSIPFALAWCMALGKTGQGAAGVKQQLVSRLPHMADQFAIFLSAGFFAHAMQLSGFDHYANEVFLHVRIVVGTEPFLLLMPLMAIVASFLGVHPLVAIALLGESLKPEVLGIGVRQLAVTLIGSSVITYMLGPFSGTLGLVQSVSRISTYRLSLWNAPYACGYFLLLAAVIVIM